MDSGLYKHHLQGYAIPAYFDWDTNTIGPYHVVSEYKYSEDYHTSIAEPNKRWLYKCMVEDPNVIACFFVNASYVCCLLVSGRYYYYSIDGTRLIEYAKNKWNYNKPDYFTIGYERTCYYCQSICMPPAQVVYSPSRMAVNVSGTWIAVNEVIEPVDYLNVQLYSRLIHSDFKYCYYTKGGDLVWKDS